MITPIMAVPLSTGSIGLTDYRSRPALGERTLLPNSTPPAPKNSGASDNGKFPREERQNDSPTKPKLQSDRTSVFAAAVIAGALSPTPQSMDELIRRIGASVIPEESHARLKDLTA